MSAQTGPYARFSCATFAAAEEKRNSPTTFRSSSATSCHTAAATISSLIPGRKTYFNNSRLRRGGRAATSARSSSITVTSELKKVLDSTIDGERRPAWTRVIIENEQRPTADQRDFTQLLRDVPSITRRLLFRRGRGHLEDGKVVSHDGAWLAGRHGAEPGIIMPDSAFMLGQRYYQELAPGVALDRAEHVETDLEIDLRPAISTIASRPPRPRRSSRAPSRSSFIAPALA